MTITDLFTRIRFPKNADNDERIRAIINTLALVTATLAFTLGIALHYFTRLDIILYPALMEALLFSTVPFINRQAGRGAAMKALFFLHAAAVIYFGLILGPHSHIHTFAIFLVGYAMLSFQRKSSRIMMALLLTTVFIFMEANNSYGWITPLPIAANAQTPLRWMVIFCAWLLNGLLLFYFIREIIIVTAEQQALVGELKVANQFKSLFLRQNNHELRNALNIINSVTQTYKAAYDNASGKPAPILVEPEELNAVYFAAQDAVEIINNTLSWSQIEQGIELPASHASFHLEQWVHQLMDTNTPHIRKKGVRLRLTIASDVPVYIVSDRKMLTRIFTNLLGNAIKFTAIRSIIDIDIRRNGDQLNVCITDQGNGISEEMKKRIFDPYVTHPAQATESTGLGLPIALHLTQSLGGQITVTDNPQGSGTTFRLTLPLIAGEAVRETAADKAFPFGFNDMSVVVIDDDEMNQRAAAHHLKRMGISQIALAGSASAGEKMIQRLLPDLILLDMEMPGTDGLTLLQRLKKDRNTRHIPVLICSGVLPDDPRHEQYSGTAGFLLKPLDYKMLQSTIGKIRYSTRGIAS
ncbi:ATP-binding response regulator [Chitinophaga arvensicola]|uniref:histidine kinase n=1 Tax=Chitinophaga arvensicola TaxID=29529 RepID=A0A1I0RPN5_9BACT|nr:hybrid sensor histidine kinase/response regulator [Chitinophaga arvensicola]SEW43242.1 Signal transduction histidine kinase [Chitinophaga arvensicola]